MSRRDKWAPKQAKVTEELRASAKCLVDVYREFMSPRYERMKQPLSIFIRGIDNSIPPDRHSLAMAICGWIENTPDWHSQWVSVLEKIQRSAFLNEKFLPTLSWLFSENPKGRGIERVLEGKYDRHPNWNPNLYRRSEEDNMY